MGGHAELLAHGIFELDHQGDRFRRMPRSYEKGQDDAASVSEHGQPLLRYALGCWPEHGHRVDVLGLRKVEMRRHAGISGIAPIRMPTGRKPYLDAGANDWFSMLSRRPG